MSVVTKESNPELYNALFPEDEIKEKIKAYYVANDIDKIMDCITNLQQEKEDYKSRKEKAVEYIKEDYERNQEVIEYCSFDEFYKKLLNILNGRSDE